MNDHYLVNCIVDQLYFCYSKVDDDAGIKFLFFSIIVLEFCTLDKEKVDVMNYGKQSNA
jgi:hypothetical protein